MRHQTPPRWLSQVPMRSVSALLSLLSVGSLVFSFDCAAAGVPQTASPLTAALKWRMIGPYRGGRTRAVAGVPSNPNLFYIGAVDGGVWKTDDAGRTWQPLFDDQPTQSIGAIAVAPSDPNIIYVGS